jgi:hypothetical protein
MEYESVGIYSCDVQVVVPSDGMKRGKESIGGTDTRGKVCSR